MFAMFKKPWRSSKPGGKEIHEALLRAYGEIDRLRERIDIISDPSLLELALEPGGSIRMGFEPNAGTKILAACFADSILGAPNWTSAEIGPFPSSEGMLLVTIQRVGKETPENTCSKRRKTIETLLEMIEQRVLDHIMILNYPVNRQNIQVVFDAAKASIATPSNPKVDAEFV